MGMKITDTDHGYNAMVNSLREMDGTSITVGFEGRGPLPGSNDSLVREAMRIEFGDFDRGKPAFGPLRKLFDESLERYQDILGERALADLVRGKSVDSVVKGFEDVVKVDAAKQFDKIIQIVRASAQGEAPDDKKIEKLRKMSNSITVTRT